MHAAGWLTRIRGLGKSSVPSETVSPASIVRSAPGLAALFESVAKDRSHVVLDLGAASDASLTVYSRIARQVRFADLSSTPSNLLHWDFPLQEAGRAAVDPYDVIFLWDTLGRLPREERSRLVVRLAELAAPTARLHMVVEAPERSGPRPIRFSLVDEGRMRHELSWDESSGTPGLMPAGVDRMLAPFQVVRAFTLKDGLREYLAVRRPPPKPLVP